MRIFANANYDFIRWRWHALILSLVLIWAGVATIYLRGGIPLGIEFSGGTLMTVAFDQPTTEDQIRHALDPVAHDAVVQRTSGGGLQAAPNTFMIRLPLRSEQEQTQLLNTGGKGIWATVFALAGILVYVTFRFRLTFAVGAVVAAFHDILITLVFLTWFHYDMSLNVIAAILTITGYSVNDTIVVFDRVRENERLMRKVPLDQIVNKSVNQTLSRTIITSGATFLAVASLYVLGGEVLRGFAFTMMVGVITGTYSTVFIAAAIAIILSRRQTSGPVAVPRARSIPA
jgi:preprotein translocase subunit SecF